MAYVFAVPQLLTGLMSGSSPLRHGGSVGLAELLSKPYRQVRGLIRRRPVLGRRRYIPATMRVEDFFRALEDRGVRYAVLRWFEHLPHLDPGEDIDMLFEDQDLPLVADLFVSDSGTACDVYSVNGSPGSSHHGMPYFPPDAARKLLARAVTVSGLYRAPCPEDHFLSLAYHALYQKGIRSGLPTATGNSSRAPDPEHDYAQVLSDLARAIGLTLSLNMESLDEYLGQQGWHPSPPMLRGLLERNPWLAARVQSAPATETR